MAGKQMKKISELVEGANTVMIAGHEHPDGDCVGSCLGLYLALRQKFPKLSVTVCLEEIVPAYRFLSGTGKVVSSCMEEPVDVFFALDCGDENRIAIAQRAFASAGKRVVVDHHISNTGYGDENYVVPHASSTSELIYEMITEEGITVTKEIAECLYLGIIQDTGVFQYSCTGKRTMEIAGELMDTGIDFSTIVEETFFQKTYLQNRILGKVLMDSRLRLGGLFIISILPFETIQAFGAEASDLDGIVSILRNTAGADCSAFFYEAKKGTWKISFRSKDIVDVSRIAKEFGGGGHVCAAACKLENIDPQDVLLKIETLIKQQLEEQSA